MRQLHFVLIVASLAITSQPAAAQRTIVDPPGAAFQDQGYREMKGLDPRYTSPVARGDRTDRTPARKQITRRKPQPYR